MQVLSTDGVTVEVHDLGGTGPSLLMAHAPGFHGRVFAPVAAHLARRFHCFALDFRGHGDSLAPPAWEVDWEGYGDDATAAAEAVAEQGKDRAGIIGVGHSLGGACLLMAAHRDPTLFRGLVVYEPVVPPPTGLTPPGRKNPAVEGVRKRRASFASIDAALADLGGRPPTSYFDEDALNAYVQGGFRSANKAGRVELKCAPAYEAATVERGSAHGTWDYLPEIDVPVWVISGTPEPFQPSSLAEQIAERLPHGNHIQYSDLDHNGPMTDPARLARIVETFADTLEV